MHRPTSLREWVVLVYGVIGIGLLPWAIWVSASLRPEHVSERWDLAWSGFDVVLAASFCLTAVAAYRRSPWVGALAAATGTLLLTDAWFDVMLESHGSELATAIFEAVAFELPMAAVCFWIARRAEHFHARAVKHALHLAPARESTAESDFVGVLEVPSDRQAARESRDADASA
jgi:hypothetical protein